ncbi:MAG: putative endonuclease [Parcubacteria group bacterium LiPW_72]|nr:MAG: putative endonuclease [Parcubacteria group bacterium LiPW_72]
MQQGVPSNDGTNPFIMYYVYILLLKNNQLYSGFTKDLKRRIAEHKIGKAKFTSTRLPIKLIHYESYLMESDARRREKYLKTTEGKRFLKRQLRDLIIQLNLNA